MLSRLSLYGASSLARGLLKFQPAAAITTSANTSASESTPTKKADAAPSGHPLEYPPPTSKRDFVNFPRPIMREAAPPVRMGFIPDSWFQLFYPKTGYTGPYMLMFSVGTYMLSKEIFIIDHNGTHAFAMILLLYTVHTKFGHKIKAFLTQKLKEEETYFNNFENNQKENIRKNIKSCKHTEDLRGDIIEILKGRVDAINMQLEMHFRDRLIAVHKAVKNKLDCQVALETAERRIAQRNLYDYVMSNVMKSITPELEKNALQRCIEDLNALAAK